MSRIEAFEYIHSRNAQEALLEERILNEIDFISGWHEDWYLHYGVFLFRKGFMADEIVDLLETLYLTARL